MNNKQQLIDYLKIVSDMEQNIFLTNQYIEILKSTVSNLAVPKMFGKPTEPDIPIYKEYDDYFTVNVLWSALFLIIAIPCFLSKHPFLGVLFSFGFLVSFIYYCIDVRDAKEKNRAKKEINRRVEQSYNYSKERYDVLLSEYIKNVSEDKERVEKELKQKQLLTIEISKLENCVEESRSRLTKIYEKGLIHKKYHNLIATLTILEYFEIGICDELTGVDGAYSIFEAQIRQDMIIYSLESISFDIKKLQFNLETIKRNQYNLGVALSSVNNQIRLFSESTDSLVRSIDSNTENINKLIERSEISNYYSERINKELQYMNQMFF